MPNTNGMRYPMTALRDFEREDGTPIEKHQVFDAVNLSRYNALKASGDAAFGDLHNSPNQISQLPSGALGAPQANATLGAEKDPTRTGVVNETQTEEGENRTATGGVIASSDPDNSNPANQGEGRSLGSVAPEVPELLKGDPGFTSAEVSTGNPGSAVNDTDPAAQAPAVPSTTKDEATEREHADAEARAEGGADDKADKTTATVGTDLPDTDNTKTTTTPSQAEKETATPARRKR